MRFRASIVFGAAIGLATLLLLYQLASLPPDTNSAVPNQSYEALASRLKRLEEDISANHNTIDEIHGLLKQIKAPAVADRLAALPPNPKAPRTAVSISPLLHSDVAAAALLHFNSTPARVLPDDCNFAQSAPSAVDIYMEDVLRTLPFDNPDGGAWKQGWEITYEKSQWTTDRPLKIFVIPHSHNDPGWLKTFERYYQDQTARILDNMARKLGEDPRRKFIWAEISFFSMWWEKQSPSVQETVRKYVSQGQLEVVAGGWVMPDEAVTHYWALVDQLVTGHEWLRTHLYLRPNNGWSIDPFGVSPTMAYILKRAGMENMLIQRTHYALKKHFAQHKNLEFRWRQGWDPESSTDMLCHMMPFYSYDVPHTCGPDPAVCCQFDFRRLPGSRMTCPWRQAPQPITQHNVQARVELLLDQYRKKAQLYRTNVLLVPLGDDFRYDTAEEWDNQYGNYQRLFDHMNAKSDYHVQASFGTLADYFHGLREEGRALQRPGASEDDEEALFPSFAGDFFSYADRDDHYWTGYFTSRPYYKARSRLLTARLRAADILLSLAAGSSDHRQQHPWLPQSVLLGLHDKLSDAHKALGLFQHHDGITGTAKDAVVLDYANKLLTGIHLSEHVIQFVSHAMLSPGQENRSPDTVYFELSEQHEGASAVSRPRVLELGESGNGGVLVYNSHPRNFRGLITVRVNTPFIRVLASNGVPVICQVDPVFDGSTPGDEYDVRFPVDLKPLSLERFFIARPSAVDRKYVFYSTITIKNEASPSLPSVFMMKNEPTDKHLSMSCGNKVAQIGNDGLVQSLAINGVTTPLALQFISYNARNERQSSGAYLFLPSGAAELLVNANPPTRIIEGPLHSLLTTKLPIVTHTMALTNSPGIDSESLIVRNLVNVRRERNFELAMRLVSDIDNKETFYTDLNGFQMARRVRASKMTLQGNYYPIATQAFIEDASGRRLTVLTGQPHGGGSLTSGQLEIMQDRRLMQDDFRGLEQGVTDNLLTPNVFRILLEKKVHPVGETQRQVYPSLLAEMSLEELLYPPIALYNTYKTTGQRNSWRPGSGHGVGCDVQLISLRGVKGSVGPGPPAGAVAALTLRRAGVDCSFPPPRANCSTNGGKVELNGVVGESFAEEVRQSTLSHLYAGVNITKSFTLSLQPMELYTFLMSPQQPPLSP